MKPTPHPPTPDIGRYACHLITALACLATLIVVDAWVLLSFALRALEVQP